MTFPFPVADHPLRPSSLWGNIKRPFPSGAWFTNLALGKGDMPVVVLPYTVKATSAGVGICYSAALRIVTSTRIQVFDDSRLTMSLMTITNPAPLLFRTHIEKIYWSVQLKSMKTTGY